jgi:hypothetical protein
MITYTTAGSWPSILRLPGLTTHKPPAYENLAHQPIKHNYNSFQTWFTTGLGLGDTTIVALVESDLEEEIPECNIPFDVPHGLDVPTSL